MVIGLITCLVFFSIENFILAERVNAAVQSLRQDFGEQHVWVPPLILFHFNY